MRNTQKVLLQRGIGLLELMLSLAIIAVLLVMATRYYQSAHRAESANQGLTLIQVVLAGAAHFKAANPDYTGLTTTSLCEQGLLPDINCTDPENPKNPWGGDLSITSNGQTFTLSMGQVPSKVCENMKSKFSSNNAACYGASNRVTFSVQLGEAS